MPKHLTESVSASATKASGRKWLVTIAKPGNGSTGKYSAEMLEKYGPATFPPGTRSYMGHAKPQDRDARDIVGSFPDGAYWDSVEQKLMGVLEARNPKWSEFIENTHDIIDMSMYVLDFEKDDNDNIIRLGHTRANSVDIVAIGGIEGAGIKELVESARDYDFKASTDESVEENRKKMELEDVTKELKTLSGLVESLVEKMSENAVSEAQVIADEEAAAKAAAEALAHYKASEALIEDARENLTVSQIDFIRESASKGDEIEPLVESFKKITEEAREGFIPSSASESYQMPVIGSGAPSAVTATATAKDAFGGK